MVNSEVKFSYLIHLVRNLPSQEMPLVESLILEIPKRSPNIRTAFARVQGARRSHQLLEDAVISQPTPLAEPEKQA